MYFGKLHMKRGHVVALDGCIIALGATDKRMKIHISSYSTLFCQQPRQHRLRKVIPTQRPRRNLTRFLSVALDRASAMTHRVTTFMPVFFLVVERTDITRMAFHFVSYLNRVLVTARSLFVHLSKCK